MNFLETKAFYALLQMAVDPECRPSIFTYKLSDSEWESLHSECLRQLLVGVAYRAIRHLPKDQQPPLQLVFQWASEVEVIKGQNELLNKEVVRLTQVFAAQGRKTAVLKGAANARLYPDPSMRQVGDIDLWVEGGRESVIELLYKMGFSIDEKALLSKHHVDLPMDEKGIVVEIHYRPTSGNVNPFTSKRLISYLEREIENTELVPEGFFVPSLKFALIMQLAHIQKHFLWQGIGFKQITDYYILLSHSSPEDRREVVSKLKSLGLWKSCGAVMWIMEYVFNLPHEKMLVKPHERRGRIMLAEILLGGNFGFDSPGVGRSGLIVSWFKQRWRNVRLLPFAPMEVLWHEVDYWRTFIRYIPLRIKLRRLSVRNV